MLGSKKKKSQKIAGIEHGELLDPVELADPDSCFLWIQRGPDTLQGCKISLWSL